MVNVALSESEVAELRRKVSTAHHHRPFTVPVQWIAYVGGPLDGLHTPIACYAAAGKFVAWCLIRDNGPLQAIYTRTDDPGRWRFHDFDEGIR